MHSLDDMDPLKPIVAYGLDSLVAIEIRNWIARELEATLQIVEILASQSLVSLTTLILAKSTMVAPQLKADWGLV